MDIELEEVITTTDQSSDPPQPLHRFQIDRINSAILRQRPSTSSSQRLNRTSSYTCQQSTILEEGEGSEFSDYSRTHRNMASGIRKVSLTARRKSSVFLPDITEIGDGNNDTFGNYGQTLQHYTNEALPKMENYRNLMSFQAAQRPTLDELHDGTDIQPRRTGTTEPEVPSGESIVKFGWIEGCLVRCLLNIWGVMLFLRLSWMVGQAGILHSLIIIVISTIVTCITTLSMSAVSTNGEMKGGGLYFMISRSLGPEFGGAVGVVFSFANAGMAALNVVGFSESMISLLKVFGLYIIDGDKNDNRIISVIALIALHSIIIIGMEWEAKAQVGLLVILLVAMLDFVIGAFIGPQDELSKARGFAGLSTEVFMENLTPGYKFSEGMEQDFFTIFSIFFPSVAGIQAGASISGDLKDPGMAIPTGTLSAIFITSGSYIIFVLLAGAGEYRDATGNLTDYENGTYRNCTEDRVCRYGLHNDYQVMQLMSAVGPIIYAGCFAATLSSALSCMVSGPKTFQALCKDEVYPYLTRFGIGYKKTDDPYWSYGLGFIIALIFILIADLNAIAVLISNMFMAAYALLNFCTFHASLVKPIGWRPTFKYYNTWLSLAGAILCVVVMFLMSWVYALVAIICIFVCYGIVLYRNPDLNWGTTTQAQTYQDALTALQRLAVQDEHVKNYRPQILCLSGFPSSRPALIDLANLITKNNSLLICGNIQEDRVGTRVRRVVLQNGYDWLNLRRVKAFYVLVDGCKFDEGCQALFQSTGIGKLAPNILLMGYKSNWEECDREEVKEYFNILHQGLDNYLGIVILRVKDPLDTSHIIGRLEENFPPRVGNVTGYENYLEPEPTDPEVVAERTPSPMVTATRRGNKLVFTNDKASTENEVRGIYRGPDGSEVAQGFNTSSPFESKQGKGVIDVWWLYDDGGLTLLLPYIIQTRKQWSQCRLRVFVLGNKKHEIQLEHRGMASLLSKFRIDYSDLTVIPDITLKANPSTKTFFETLIKDFRGDPDKFDDPEMLITDAELLGLKEKTNRHLRLRELLLQYSAQSNLIAMTLPIPRKGQVSAPLYMAWLETLTRDMPPFLLIRGNQTSVLTFYS